MSPKGVNYYELSMDCVNNYMAELFPSPTGVTYYELSYGLGMVSTIFSGKLFPSPTGVNHYEWEQC